MAIYILEHQMFYKGYFGNVEQLPNELLGVYDSKEAALGAKDNIPVSTFVAGATSVERRVSVKEVPLNERIDETFKNYEIV